MCIIKGDDEHGSRFDRTLYTVDGIIKRLCVDASERQERLLQVQDRREGRSECARDSISKARHNNNNNDNYNNIQHSDGRLLFSKGMCIRMRMDGYAHILLIIDRRISEKGGVGRAICWPTSSTPTVAKAIAVCRVGVRKIRT